MGTDELEGIFKRKNIKKINIKYGDTQIKLHSKVECLGCLLEKTMSGKAMTLKIDKIKFLYDKIVSDTSTKKNALIQPRFHYVCSAWYSDLQRK